MASWYSVFVVAWCPTCGWSRRDDSTDIDKVKRIRSAARYHANTRGHEVSLERGEFDFIEPTIQRG